MFARTVTFGDIEYWCMTGFPTPFGGSSDGDSLFDDSDEVVENNLPTPGQFLENHDVLSGDGHVAFHETTKEIFEVRGVYDMTFGYNLARLNLDSRHRDAGYRYAKEGDDPSVLRAEFTPTTPFCPQSNTLTKGSFRAWNELRDQHDYDLVRVRVNDMHHRSGEINAVLEALETQFRETGSVTHLTDGDEGAGANNGRADSCDDGTETTSHGNGPDAPF
jgi:hypothetical protein